MATQRQSLDGNDPDACAGWLDALDAAAQDLIAAAAAAEEEEEDQVRLLAYRDLGRRTARTKVVESSGSLASLIAHARAGLPRGGTSAD